MSNIQKSLKVLFVTPSYAGIGGAPLNERQLIESLSKRVACVYVLNLLNLTLLLPAYRKSLSLKSTRPNIKQINVPLIPFVPERLVPLYTIRLIIYGLMCACFARLLKSLRLIDVVYVRDPEIAIGFSILKRFTGPYALKFAGFHTEEGLKFIKDRVQRWLFFSIFERLNYCTINDASLVLIQSDYYKQAIKNRYAVNGNKPFLILPAGIDMDKILRVRAQKNNSENNKPPEDTLSVGFIGSVTWWDGLDILLESIPDVLRTHPNVTLRFVLGSGDPLLLSKLKSRAQILEIPVEFRGPLNHEAALVEMSQLSALVLPRRRTLSTEITVPIKVKEALALGVPVIVTKHKIFKTMFRDHEDLIFVEPDPKDVAEKITLLLSNPNLAKYISVQSQKKAESFSYDRISADFADALALM